MMGKRKSTAVAEQAGTGLVSGPFALTKTGLAVKGQPTAEEWDQAGDMLCQAHGALQWWIGDWLLYGEGRPEWGDKYAEACERFGREEQSLKNYKWVAGSVELSRRRDNLSWRHHETVAPLTPAKQKKWLKKAEKEGWSVAELRRAIRDAQPTEDIPLPDGKYNLIYADPPWSYNDKCEEGAVQSGGCERHYSSLAIPLPPPSCDAEPSSHARGSYLRYYTREGRGNNLPL